MDDEGKAIGFLLVGGADPSRQTLDIHLHADGENREAIRAQTLNPGP